MAEKSPFRGFRGFNTPNNTQVPDELFDELMVHLSGAELKVLLYVIRRTYGFKRESDNISLSQMLTGIVKRDGVRLDHGTGLSKPTLLSALRSLAQKGMIVPERRRSTERGDEATTYRLHLVGDAERTAVGAPDNGETEAYETNTPVVKKLAQGGARNATTPVGKESAQAVVKKSAPQVTVTNKQDDKVVNALPANDQKSSSSGNRRPDSKTTPTISDRALRATYKLTDGQIGRVHWLVEKQLEILGSGDRNHGHYVKRAAEAVRDGHGDFLDHKLGDFKQAATKIPVGSQPAYFHAMYTEAMQKHHGATADPTPSPARQTLSSNQPQRLGEAVGDRFHPSQEPAPDESRDRLIADAERRGFPIPAHIRTADIRAVNRWWATLPETSPKRN